MKKLFALLLAVMMIAAMSVTAFAATNEGGNTTIDISATFKAGTAADDVISVVVEWGAMSFEYTEGSEGTWNPDTHGYDGATEAEWTQSDNYIKLTNHSNVGVKADLGFASDVATVNGSFYKGDATVEALTLATAVGTAYDEAPNDSVNLVLGGTLTADDAGKVGTVTVSISKAQ